jgi:sugar phosphate permease
MVTQELSPPRGWYYGWNIVAVSILAALAANGVPLNCVSLYLEPWAKETGAPISQLLLALSAMMLVMGVAAAALGGVADRKPARLLVSLGLLGLALISFGVSFATKAWQIELAYALLIPVPLVAATSVVTNPLVSRWFVRRLGLALGLTSFGIGLAGIFLPPLIAALLPEVGWRMIFRASAAAVGLIVAPLAFFVIRQSPTEKEGLHYVEPDAGSPAGGHGGEGHLTIIDVLRRKNFWFVLAAFVPMGFIYIGGVNNLAPLVASHGFDQKAGGFAISAFNIASVAATLLVGLLTDRFGNRLPLAGLAFVAALSSLVLGLGHSLAALYAGAALAGLVGGIWVVLASAAAGEFGAGNVGRVFGLFSLVLPLQALGGVVIARVKEVTGDYTLSLLVIAALCVLGGVVALLMRERRSQASLGPGA